MFNLFEITESIIILVVLFINTISDIRYRKISLRMLLVTSIIGIIIRILVPIHSIVDIVLGIIIGIFIIAISIISKGKIGQGDGLVFCTTGIFIGGIYNITLLLYSLTLASIYSITIIVFKKANRKKEIPFVPFIFTAYILFLII